MWLFFFFLKLYSGALSRQRTPILNLLQNKSLLKQKKGVLSCQSQEVQLCQEQCVCVLDSWRWSVLSPSLQLPKAWTTWRWRRWTRWWSGSNTAWCCGPSRVRRPRSLSDSYYVLLILYVVSYGCYSHSLTRLGHQAWCCRLIGWLEICVNGPLSGCRR